MKIELNRVWKEAADSLFHDKELSDSIQSGIFLGQISDYSQLKTYSCSTKLITY